MDPINFPQANRLLGKPESMTDEECGPLAVFTDEKVCISCWKGSLKERIAFLLSGKLWLWVYSGGTQPPVAVDLRREIFGKQGNG